MFLTFLKNPSLIKSFLNFREKYFCVSLAKCKKTPIIFMDIDAAIMKSGTDFWDEISIYGAIQ